MKLEKKNLPMMFLVIGLIAVIISISTFVRMGPLDSPSVLDFDPHWYYRHALEIMDNGFLPPEWDILSFYPPGRPFDTTLGTEYLMILFFQTAQIFDSSIDFLTVAKWSPIILVAMGVVAAFLMGRLISNNWGGMFTAIFAVLSPTFIGVSMAAYTDNDASVVFYTFFTTLSILLAIKKRTIPYISLAIASNVLFAFTWTGGWLPAMMFLLFLPSLFIFRIIEQFIHTLKASINFKEIFLELKKIIIPLGIVLVASNIIAALFGLSTIIDSFEIALGFLSGEIMLVNISVAELQPINVFSLQGLTTIISRVGLLPTLFTIIGLPAFVIFKLWRKKKANFMEIFLFLWAAASFYAILSGTRFSLEFVTAAAATAGYIIGNMVYYFKGKPPILGSVFFGIVLLLTIMFVSDAIQIGIGQGGLRISDNWYNALDWLKENGNSSTLVVTWWDPGHIIADLSGLKVMADGAHCAPGECIPYNHNIRIQDMGRIFSMSNEIEALKILNKYTSLTPEQCNQAREKFGDRMPENACDPIDKVYVLATNDLIGKYFWLSYFGSCLGKHGTQAGESCYYLPSNQFKNIAEGRNYMQCGVHQQLSQQSGTPSYVCQTGIQTTISLIQSDTDVAAVLNSPKQGVRNAIIKQMVLYQDGVPVYFDYSDRAGALDGLVYVDPSFQVLFYLDPQIKDSIFTNMFFFNGEGNSELGLPTLNKFQLVYNNPEVRIFEVSL